MTAGEIHFENQNDNQLIAKAKSFDDALTIADELNRLLKLVEDNMNSPKKFKDFFGSGTPEYFATESEPEKTINTEYAGKHYTINGPCPFCGSEQLEILWNYSARIYCNECHMNGPSGCDPLKAVERWNAVIL